MLKGKQIGGLLFGIYNFDIYVKDGTLPTICFPIDASVVGLTCCAVEVTAALVIGLPVESWSLKKLVLMNLQGTYRFHLV